jgi:hypothetical protein
VISTFCRVIPFLVLLLCVSARSSFGQQAVAQAPPAAMQQAAQPADASTSGGAAAVISGDQNASDPGADDLIRDEPMDDLHDVYQKTTLTNFSKMYWGLGMLDLKDDDAIEQFLEINDCGIYDKYVHNDFEWAKIKQATRKMLSKTMALFPTRYEIMVPIDIGQYDQEKAEFLVAPDSAMINVKRMDIAPNMGVQICGSMDEIKNYPRNLILTLIRPFTFKVIPASAELAELYINSTQEIYNGMSAKNAVEAYKREGFLRLKVRIIQYVETIDIHDRWRAVVIGTIEGYEVYADRDRLKLLYEKDMTKENLHHRHHHRTADDTIESSVRGNPASPGNNQETPADTTTGDNTSEIDSGSGVSGSAVDPGGMGTSPDVDTDTDVDTDVVTHSPSNPPAPAQSQQQAQ